jgi:hypothetical protein
LLIIAFFRIEPVISKEDTHMRPAIPAKIRLLVTLRYLSGGVSYGVLEDIFRIPKTTLSRIIPSVCDALWNVLNRECISLPQSKEEWKMKAQEFKEQWQYPFALGALDGKVSISPRFFPQLFSYKCQMTSFSGLSDNPPTNNPPTL